MRASLLWAQVLPCPVSSHCPDSPASTTKPIANPGHLMGLRPVHQWHSLLLGREKQDLEGYLGREFRDPSSWFLVEAGEGTSLDGHRSWAL